MDVAEEEAPQASHTRSKHIKKRSLKNKALTITFNEKDLKDYVTGFHKRNKKRRKQARQQLEAVDRGKRIESSKKLRTLVADSESAKLVKKLGEANL